MEFLIIIGGFILYIFPALIASHRKHRNANAICLLNLIMGWTIAGWFIALIWSSTDNVREVE
jgi:hypothetical protein